MRLGGTTAPTYTYGDWYFSTADSINGLVTDSHSQGDHNHGIPNGTVLLTATGNVTFVSSGGFSHSHNVEN